MRCWFDGPVEEITYRNPLRGSPGLKRGEMDALSNEGKTGERFRGTIIASLPC